MLVSIRGYYEDGKITLNEVPPFNERIDVIVTFLAESAEIDKMLLDNPEDKLSAQLNFDKPPDHLIDNPQGTFI